VSKRSTPELDDQRRIGARIKQHRTRLGLTIAQVADHLEVPYLMVQRLERGTATLTVPRLIRLASAFGVEPGELLKDFAGFEANETLAQGSILTAEESRLLQAFHAIPDKVQRRNLLDLMERMA
jgi:transcriptional regulator with XRE-family HTH domain